MQPIADFAYQCGEHIDFFMVESAGRFIEQQECRFAGQRTAEFDALLRAEWHRRNRRRSHYLEPEKTYQLTGALCGITLFLRNPRHPQRIGQKPAARAAMTSEQNVVEHRQAAKQRQVLKGPAYAESGDSMPGHRAKAVAGECNLTTRK